MYWSKHAWFEAPEGHLRAIESYYINRIKPQNNSSIPPRSYFESMAVSQALQA